MSTSELVSKSEEGLPKRSLNQRLLDAVFGFDYFISYRWDDAQAYAAALARALRRRGFTVFLDRKEMGVGENWMFAVHYALKRTTRLVLIGSPLVHDSKAVEDELRVFTGAGKKIIPISFGGSLDSEGLSQSPLRPYLLKTLLRAEEPPDALRKGEPSLEIVRQLTISFHQERQTEKRTRLLLMFLAVLGLLLAATVGGATWAVRERNRAVQKNIELQHSFSIADFQRAISDLSQNDWESGTAHLTRALSRDAANAAAAQRLYSILAYEPYFALTDSFSPPGNRFKTLDASADGRRLLAVATNGTAWLWLSGRPPEQLNITNVLAASLTQDGDTVVVMTRDALVRWDV